MPSCAAVPSLSLLGRATVLVSRFVVEASMRRVNVLAVVLSLVATAGLGNPVQAQAPVAGATAFEGARLIVGDGSVIENGTLVVDGARIVAAGKAADVQVPSSATRVTLAGKTVMPMLIDTHV